MVDIKPDDYPEDSFEINIKKERFFDGNFAPFLMLFERSEDDSPKGNFAKRTTYP